VKHLATESDETTGLEARNSKNGIVVFTRIERVEGGLDRGHYKIPFLYKLTDSMPCSFGFHLVKE